MTFIRRTKTSPLIVAILALIAVAFGACGGSPPPPPPPYPETAIDLAMETIEERPQVVDSDLYEKEGDLFLILVVQFGTSDNAAKRHMEDFAALVKSLGPEDPPTGGEIGKGMYDYNVAVFYPGAVLIDRGAKVSASPKITW